MGSSCDAHMRTFVVVEVNCTGYGRDDFSDACKVHVFKEFVFHCIVDSIITLMSVIVAFTFAIALWYYLYHKVTSSNLLRPSRVSLR